MICGAVPCLERSAAVTISPFLFLLLLLFRLVTVAQRARGRMSSWLSLRPKPFRRWSHDGPAALPRDVPRRHIVLSSSVLMVELLAGLLADLVVVAIGMMILRSPCPPHLKRKNRRFFGFCLHLRPYLSHPGYLSPFSLDMQAQRVVVALSRYWQLASGWILLSDNSWRSRRGASPSFSNWFMSGSELPSNMLPLIYTLLLLVSLFFFFLHAAHVQISEIFRWIDTPCSNGEGG